MVTSGREELLRIPQVAENLNTGLSFVKGLISRGRLPVVRLAKRAVRVRRSDLDKLIEECLVTPPSRHAKSGSIRGNGRKMRIPSHG